MPSMKFFWDATRCVHWRLLPQSVSMSWQLTLKDGEESLRGSTAGGKAACSPGICLVPQNGVGSEKRPQQVVCYRVRDVPNMGRGWDKAKSGKREVSGE